MRIRTIAVHTASLLAVLTPTAPTQNSPTVSPGDRAGLEGSTSTSYPLGRHNSRFQQMFKDLGPARVLVGHAYRRDGLGNRGDVSPFKTSMAIHLSTTTTSPEKASRTFAANAGPTPALVLPRTWISFPKTSRPTSLPGTFDFAVPYQSPYVWAGKETLCLDVSIDNNELATGKGKTFSPSLDAQELYASGRNLQPGYPYRQGCTATGNPRPAAARFELRHLGTGIDLRIDAVAGVPSIGSGPAASALLLGAKKLTYPWPPGSNCNLYTSVSHALLLPGANTAGGDWSGTVAVGLAPTAGFTMFGQILSASTVTGEVVLSDASELITPPAGAGVVSSRIVNASDRLASTGTVSFAVPITQFR